MMTKMTWKEFRMFLANKIRAASDHPHLIRCMDFLISTDYEWKELYCVGEVSIRKAYDLLNELDEWTNREFWFACEGGVYLWDWIISMYPGAIPEEIDNECRKLLD